MNKLTQWCTNNNLLYSCAFVLISWSCAIFLNLKVYCILSIPMCMFHAYYCTTHPKSKFGFWVSIAIILACLILLIF